MTTPFLSVISTITVLIAGPLFTLALQSSGSCGVAYVVPPNVRSGASSSESWHLMQAMPGFIAAPSSTIDMVMLVHCAGASKGFGPASASLQEPIGVPASTQVSKAASSSALGPAAGAGGIGLAASFMRSSDRAALDLAGSPFVGAIRSAYVTSGCGAPPIGVLAWHEVHFVASSVATSHGRPSMPALPVEVLLPATVSVV